MRNLVHTVLHAHLPASVHAAGPEHVIMPAVYAVGAALVHHPLGSLAIAGGYATVGVMAARSHRDADRTGS